MRRVVSLIGLVGIAYVLAVRLIAYAEPTNDDFASAAAVVGVRRSANIDTSTATLEPGLPQPCSLGAKTVWFTFTAPAPGLYEVDTFGSGFDTVLAIYTGSSLSTLSEVDCSDDVPTGP